MKNRQSKYANSREVPDIIAGVAALVLVTVLVVVGYWITPVLFSELSAQQAGEIAGTLFNGVSLVVAVMLTGLIGLYLFYKKPLKQVTSVLFALSVMLLLRIWISPWMQEIKTLYPLGLDKDSVDWPLFAGLHGVYQIGYLLTVLVLLYWGVRQLLNVRNRRLIDE